MEMGILYLCSLSSFFFALLQKKRKRKNCIFFFLSLFFWFWCRGRERGKVILGMSYLIQMREKEIEKKTQR